MYVNDELFDGSTEMSLEVPLLIDTTPGTVASSKPIQLGRLYPSLIPGSRILSR
jgi:hypothetical protein